MTGSLKRKKHLPLYLLMALLIVMFLLPTAAGAYIARSTGSGIPGYGIARSQPQSQSITANPGPAPALPPHSFYGSSYGLARSSNLGFHGTVPAVPQHPVTPPAQPEDPALPGPPAAPEPHPDGGEAAALNPQERQLLNLVNSERTSRGMVPLQLDAQLTYLARLKSQDMIDLNYFAHASPTYGSTGEMLRSAGIKFSLAAENIGKGGNINTIFSAFMGSSGHRNKIVDSRYTRTGIGIIYKPGQGYLVTQLFLLPR